MTKSLSNRLDVIGTDTQKFPPITRKLRREIIRRANPHLSSKQVEAIAYKRDKDMDLFFMRKGLPLQRTKYFFVYWWSWATNSDYRRA